VPTVAVVYYSSQGHTHELALAVAEGAKAVPGTAVEVVRLQDADIQNGRWKNDAQVATLTAADAIVFGTPMYMGGYSAQMKAFIDACGGIWFQQGWKDKIAAGFTHSQGLSGDKLNTLQGLVVNAMQHGMVWVGTGLMVEGPAPENVNRLSSYSGAMAQSFPATAAVSAGDKKTAELLGKRVAEATARWVKGKG
jgi:NAD(P)H dehydrogenase (quinone)